MVGYTAAFQISKIYVMSLCVGMNGHFNVGLYLVERLLWFVFFFKKLTLVFWL